VCGQRRKELHTQYAHALQRAQTLRWCNVTFDAVKHTAWTPSKLLAITARPCRATAIITCRGTLLLCGDTHSTERCLVCRFSSTSSGVFTKSSSWQVKEPIPNTTVTFYGDCFKRAKTSPRTLATKKLTFALRQRTDSHFLLPHVILYQITRPSSHARPAFLSFPDGR
jgi:hypothetical protein